MKNVMKKLFIINSLKANNKKRIKNNKTKSNRKIKKIIFNSFDANEYTDEDDDYNHFHDICENDYDIYNDSFKIFDFEKQIFDENANIKNIDFILSKSILSNKNIFFSNSIIDANFSFIDSIVFFDFSRNISQKRVRDYDVYEINDE